MLSTVPRKLRQRCARKAKTILRVNIAQNRMGRKKLMVRVYRMILSATVFLRIRTRSRGRTSSENSIGSHNSSIDNVPAAKGLRIRTGDRTLANCGPRN
mmetsp:Transcript_19819/g.40964  ORF Transcript_19819/g.40964 Transcript_19819/m.40964 type:complete len:99 (+) Transcript_19819:985-1281(+)